MYQDPSQTGGAQPMDGSAGAEQGGYRSIWNQQSSSHAGSYAALQPDGMSGFGQQQGMGGYAQPGAGGFGQQPGMGGYAQPGAGGFGQQQGMGGYAQPGMGGFGQQGFGAQMPYQPSGPSQPAPFVPNGSQSAWLQPDSALQQPQPWTQQSAWPQMPGAGGSAGMAPMQEQGFGQVPPQNWQEAQLYNGPVQNPHRPFPWRLMFVILVCGVMPLFFIITIMFNLLSPSGTGRMALTAVLSAGALGTLIAMWLLRPFEKATHIMISALYVLALIVTIFLGVRGSAANRPAAQPTPTPAPTAAVQQQQESAGLVEVVAQEEEAVANEEASSERLRDFLNHWIENNLDYMVTICAPSWHRSIRSGDAKTALYGILQARGLLSYEILSKTGTENDQMRKITIQARIDRHTGTVDAQREYQMEISMVRENDTWYVDPASITTYEPTPAPVSTSSKPTQPPTPAPAAQTTVLYYNPDGGKFYHLDPNCPTLAEKYKPLKGSFYYAQINEGTFKNLQPCTSCGAPNRP